MTVAMLYARNGMIPPDCWNHDPNIVDNYNNTVAMILANKGIVPPK